MLANPLYARYRVFSISPKRDPDTLPSERMRLLYCVNFILSFIFSITTYSLCFTNIIKDSITDVIYTNSSMLSVLTPQPWILYFQWFAYLSQLTIIVNYIWKYGNKDTMLKLYDMSSYFIILNLIQSGVNLLSYSSPVSYVLNIFSNIAIFSILISLFIKEHVFKYTDTFTKFLSIDFPLTFNYFSCLINLIFSINEIIYYSDKSLIYSDTFFSGLMAMLFILNITLLISTRNIVNHFLYTILIVFYGGNTFNIEDYITTNQEFTKITMYTLDKVRMYIVVPFILNLFIIFGYIGCYHHYKNRILQNQNHQNHQNTTNTLTYAVPICENTGKRDEMKNIENS